MLSEVIILCNVVTYLLILNAVFKNYNNLVSLFDLRPCGMHNV